MRKLISIPLECFVFNNNNNLFCILWNYTGLIVHSTLNIWITIICFDPFAKKLITWMMENPSNYKLPWEVDIIFFQALCTLMYWLPNLKQRRYAFNIVSKRRRWQLECRCWLLWLALLKQNQSCNSEFCIRILIVNQYSPCFLNRIIRDQIINCDKYLLAEKKWYLINYATKP